LCVSLCILLFITYCFQCAEIINNNVEGASQLITPLGDLSVDSHLRDELLLTKKFGNMKQDVDEKEHSGEMQYPYIQKIINDARRESSGGEEYNIKVLPIMVGSIGVSKEESIGRLLSPFLSDRGIFTVISSDFCHCECRCVHASFVYEDCQFIYFLCVD